MLNNIPHIKAYRMNIGDHLAELALQYGADDIDGTVQKNPLLCTWPVQQHRWTTTGQNWLVSSPTQGASRSEKHGVQQL